MFGLFRKREEAAAFPDGRVGYAVGDIHGCADLLAALLTRLEEGLLPISREPPVIIFLGDYVDRGPDSRGVIDLLLSGRPYGFERRFLRGNHEQAMERFLRDPLGGRAWLSHGGLETLASYGVQPPAIGAAEAILAAAAALRQTMPEAHLTFLRRLDSYCLIGDYAFVHAGVDPEKSLAEQDDADLLWIRDRFLTSPKSFSHKVVHGHTPVAKPYLDHRRIGLDTGAYVTGILSAARFEGANVEIIQIDRREMAR